MKILNAAQFGLSAVLATLLGLAACSTTDSGQDSSDVTSCEGAYLDSGGRCRLPNGQFARATCCAVDQAGLAQACEDFCALQQSCEYDPATSCVADCVGRGTECTASRLADFASCSEYYAECDSGEDLFQCADESGCLAEQTIVTPPNEKEPYQPACDAFCEQMTQCAEGFDDYYCATSCLADCSVGELQALDACNAAKSADCGGQDAYVECLRAGADCIAPPVAPIHVGAGPWGDACVAYCDIVWACDYGYSSSCMADCMANEQRCTTDDLGTFTDCTEWYSVCDDGEDFGQCVDENVACFTMP